MKAGFNAVTGLAVVSREDGLFDFVWIRPGGPEYERDVPAPLAGRHIRMSNSHNRMWTDEVDYETLEDVGAALVVFHRRENMLHTAITILDPQIGVDLRREFADRFSEVPTLDDDLEWLKTRMYPYPAPPTATFDVADSLTGALGAFYRGLPRREVEA